MPLTLSTTLLKYKENNEYKNANAIQGPQGEQGIQGIQGVQGPTGLTPEFKQVNAVAGVTAAASITKIGGKAEELQLNLTLPRGNTGEKGEKGETGATGATGATGPTGATPNLQIGTVSSGSTPAATITGTAENPLLNLTLVPGAKGDKGDTGPRGATGIGVDTLTFGGTNLIPNTEWYEEVKYDHIDGGTNVFTLVPGTARDDGDAYVDTYFNGNGYIHWESASTDSTLYFSSINISGDTDYTISFKGMGTQIVIDWTEYDNQDTQLEHGSYTFSNLSWGRHETTFTTAPLATKIVIGIAAKQNSMGYVGCFKLEYGNKAMDWSPAPADYRNQFIATENLIDDVSLAKSEEILEAVDNLQVGGVNLILDTGWHRAVGSKWTFTDNTAAFIKFPYNTNESGNTESDNNFGGCGFVNWNSPASRGTMWSRTVKVSAGQRYTFSFRYRGEGLKAIVAGYNSESTQIWGGEWPYTSATTKDFSRTITIPANVVNIQLVFQIAASTSGVLGRIKMEQGDKMTTWTPAPQDNPGYRFSSLVDFQHAIFQTITETSAPDVQTISTYPTRCGVYRVGNPAVTGLPPNNSTGTGYRGYGVLLIVGAGEYFLHLTIDTYYGVYITRTSALSTPPTKWVQITTGSAIDAR